MSQAERHRTGHWAEKSIVRLVLHVGGGAGET